MKLALSANVREWWTRTAAKRRKNAAHGASRGRGADREPALEGRKTNVAYVRQHPSPSYLQHSRTPPSDQTWISIWTVRLSRWHCSRDARDRADHQRHRRSRPHARAYASSAGSGRTCLRRKNKFLSLGSRKMEPKFWMANRLRSFQRQRIECHRRKEIYCQPGRTSQEAFISGWVPCIPQEEWDRRGREIYLGLVSFAPLGLASSLYSTHGLRRGLHSFAA